MSAAQTFDVIVVGGGPAGLSVAAQLAKRHEVLVVETGAIGETQKIWFVPPDVVDRSVEPFTYSGVTRFLANPHTGAALSWRSKLYDRYPHIDGPALLAHWANNVRSRGSSIADHTTYLGHRVENGGVTVETTKGPFRAALLVDASGHASTIVDAHGIDRSNYLWWSVFGCVARHPNGLGELEVGDYEMWTTFASTNRDDDASLANGRPVFEYEILDERTSFSLILFLRKEKETHDRMKETFLRLLRNESATKHFRDVEVMEFKHGWYPSAHISQQIASDRVAFIGDAGCWTAPCGWGMAFILNNYRRYASRLSHLVRERRLDAASLRRIVDLPNHTKYQILVNATVTRFLAHGRASQIDKFITFFHGIDPGLCEKIFTLQLSTSEAKEVLDTFIAKFGFSELTRILPPSEYGVAMRTSFQVALKHMPIVGGALHSATLRDTPWKQIPGFSIEDVCSTPKNRLAAKLLPSPRFTEDQLDVSFH